MIEKVNPKHPDKIADRIAGAIVDLGYKLNENPKVACEVLIGHGECNIILETNVEYKTADIQSIVDRIAESHQNLNLKIYKQDVHLADNQHDKFRCGDNGIFKGTRHYYDEELLNKIAFDLYKRFPSDGKYITDENKNKLTLIICQSNADKDEIMDYLNTWGDSLSDWDIIINPLGYWTGGLDVDSGATNRKLGSDMGHSVTGGGLHGKDLSKADVAINIYAHIKALVNDQLHEEKDFELSCAIGDEYVDGKSYQEIVNIAKKYINDIGGFEKFAEWGFSAENKIKLIKEWRTL